MNKKTRETLIKIFAIVAIVGMIVSMLAGSIFLL